MNIKSLTLQDMEAAASVEGVELENIKFPLSAEGIRLGSTKAGSLRVEQISV